jgi:hypothetical protein
MIKPKPMTQVKPNLSQAEAQRKRNPTATTDPANPLRIRPGSDSTIDPASQRVAETALLQRLQL